MTFDFYVDYRASPNIREDSWIGAETDGETLTGTARVTNGATLTIQDGATLTLNGDLIVEAGARLVLGQGVTLQFAPGKRLRVYGDFDADGATLTATSTSQGWGGLRYESGSTGTIENSTIERVGGYGTYAVRISNASPTVTGSLIWKSATSSASGGVYIAGSSADPYLFQNTIRELTSYGVIATGQANARLRFNVIQDNTGEGLFAASYAEVFVYGENTFTGNRDGIESSRGDVYLGRFYYPTSGYHADGYNLITSNDNHGIYARNRGYIAAGGSSQWRYNSLENNLGYEAVAAGTASSFVASTNWWGPAVVTSPGDVLTTAYTLATNGGSRTILDVCDTQPGPDPQFGSGGGTAGCLNPLSTNLSSSRTADPAQTVDSARKSSMGVSARLAASTAGETEGANAAGWHALLETDPWRALDVLDAVVNEGGPDAPEALAKMVHVADQHTPPTWLDSVEPGAPREVMAPRAEHDGTGLRASTRGRLEAHARRGSVSQQAWARVALIETHLGEQNERAALREADRLLQTAENLDAEERAAVVGFAYALQVHTRTDAGDLEGAKEALAAWIAASPEDPEVAVAMDYVTTSQADAEARPRLASPPGVRSEAGTTPEAFGLEAPYPNPTATSVAVPLVLPEAAEARVVVYDVLGRVVAVLSDGPLEPGRHTFEMTTTTLAAGVYVVRAVSGQGVATQTFTVAR